MPDNPAGWPDALMQVVDRFITCEFATLTKKNTPITYPLTPYLGEDGRTVDVSTGLSYPAKAERARRNPKVGMLFSNPFGSGVENAPTVLVLGDATVRDHDVQGGMDRYVRLGVERFPEAYKGQPRFLLKRMQWYYARIWVLVTPLKVMWWSGSDTGREPHVWTAPEGTSAPPSDPAPPGAQPPPWAGQPADWRDGAQYAAANMDPPVLTVVDPESGYPVPFRTTRAEITPDGFSLDVPAGMPATPIGPACLTFHSHPEVFISQENAVFVGEVTSADGKVSFRVERRLADFSLGTSKMSTTMTFLRSYGKLMPQLRRELERRGQKMPEVRFPD
jgi:hypothetical protein